MIIKYTNETRQDFFTTLNRDYIVLSVSYMRDGVFYTILSDNDNGVIIVSAEECAIADPEIPFDWGLKQDAEGVFQLSPLGFTENFWDKYYDDDSEAQKIFYRIYEKLKKFHGWGE